MFRKRFVTLLVNILLIATGLTIGADEQPTNKIDFAHEIQPIFARRCFKCHGPNESKAGLQLHTRKTSTAQLKSGEVAIAPSDPEKSRLLTRVRSSDSTTRMPPEGKPLTQQEISLLEKWIQQGAHWADHWSFRPPQRSSIPSTTNSMWVQNPIDAFVLNRLEVADLGPNPPANKLTLLRRAYYDLIGLPPTPDQVSEFLNNKSPRAYEQLIDELLKSPQYGERWARHWLDLVRYAETNGYERDSNKDLIWKYRDYIIRSFNDDVPFSRFVREQIAGDEVPLHDAKSVTATGYYRLGVWDDEPADRELARYDYLDDILRTTSEAFLGLTVGCARCHDHKIDPISQKDYYSMLSFFANISPHGRGNVNHIPVSHAADQLTYKREAKSKRKLETRLQQEITAIEQKLIAKLAETHPEFKIKTTAATSGREEHVLPDSVEEGQQWKFTLRKPRKNNWFEIAFNDQRWQNGVAGFGAQGTPGAHVRTNWRSNDIWLRKDFRLEAIPSKLILNIHHDEDTEVYLNGKLIATLKDFTTKYRQIDVTQESQDVLQTGRNTVAIHCRQTSGGQYIDAGLVADLSETPIAKLMKNHGATLLSRETQEKWATLRDQLSKSKSKPLKLRTELAMAVAETGPRKMWILGRGNPTSKGEEVGPSFPQILNPPRADLPPDYVTQQSSGRRRVLANWIASPDNPLTARVFVNRIWQHHFGRGIVRSTSDFGFQGTPPTHPALLDWLATEFIKRGWHIKEMHRLIMTSNTYKMSSQGNTKALAQDPTNDLFWRFNMRRLSAEEIRDSILSVVGTLNPKMYGPSIYPPLPQEVLATASRPNAAWGKSSPEESARRTIYVHVKRSLRPPMLANFDSPDTDTSCAVRLTTTVPTQALGMLNSVFMNQQAALFAKRIRAQKPDNLKAQISLAIRMTTGRTPNESEVENDAQFIRDVQDEDNVSAGDAFVVYCLMILNTNEFVYLD